MTCTFPFWFFTWFIIPRIALRTTNRQAFPAFSSFRQIARTVHSLDFLCSVRRLILSPLSIPTPSSLFFSCCCRKSFFCLNHLRKCHSLVWLLLFFYIFRCILAVPARVALCLYHFFKLVVSLSVILTDRGVYVAKKATPIMGSTIGL